jgi:uncharacterized protein (TIGR02147 family)
MNLAAQTDYKAAIKARLKELQQLRPGLTLKKVAAKVPIQYTYLSKVLNDRSTHLNDDDLFHVGQLLEFFPQEIEFLLLLRAHQTATLPARKQFAFQKLEKARKQIGVRATIQDSGLSQITQEMSYLFDPFCMLVYVALNIPGIRKDPRQLCSLLGITQPRLKDALKKLALVDFIEMDQGPFSVTKVNKGRLHYSKDHPLMRVHQHLFKLASQDQLLKLSEEDKESFQVAFTADRKAFDQIRAEFRQFLKRVEEIAHPSKDESVLQMNFDLFFWL